MTLQKVCNINIAPSSGSLKAFDLGRIEVLVANVNGKLYCTAARCPHAGGAPLAEGTLQGVILTCPWHEAQFRVTDGQLLRGPAKDNLLTYKSLVRDEQLFIEL